MKLSSLLGIDESYSLIIRCMLVVFCPIDHEMWHPLHQGKFVSLERPVHKVVLL